MLPIPRHTRPYRSSEPFVVLRRMSGDMIRTTELRLAGLLQLGCLRQVWAHKISFSFVVLRWGELWLICPWAPKTPPYMPTTAVFVAGRRHGDEKKRKQRKNAGSSIYLRDCGGLAYVPVIAETMECDRGDYGAA